MQALRIGEDHYRQMFEKNRAVKLLIDPESGLILQANPAAYAFYGYTPEQMQQMTIWQVNTQPEAEVREHMAQAMTEQESTFTFQHRLASGQVRDVEVFASPIDLHGRRLLYSIVHDITEHRQAERTLWQHTKRLQILHDIDQAVLAVKSPQEIAEETLQHLRQVVPARHASILLFDVVPHAADVLAVESAGDTRMRAGERLPAGTAWAPDGQWQNNVYLIDDLAQVVEPSSGIEALVEEGVRGLLSVPLVTQRQLIGRLNLGSGQPGEFTLQHLDIARQVADSLAVALQNGRLYQAEQRARQVAETLRAANVALTQSLNLRAVFDTLLDYLRRLIPYDSASVMLTHDDESLSIEALSGYDRWDGGQASTYCSLVFDLDSTPSIAAVAGSQRTLLIDDTAAFPGWDDSRGSIHVRNWLGVPLVARGQLIGICSIDKAEPGFFTEDHVRLAEALAAQAAVAILNARLYEEVRAGRSQLQTLSRRLVDVQERERRHVARELHDEAGQMLTSLIVSLGLLERKAECAQPVVDELEDLKRRVGDVLEGLHRLAVDLRPASLDHLGLVAALRQYAETVSRQSGISVQFETFGLNGERLPADQESVLYRIVQEALTNVVRHSAATQAGVLLERRGERMLAIVEDNGAGFDATRAMREGRLGLVGMRERAEMLSGQLIVESAPNRGTSVFVELPWRRE